jgi:hypothetical protein
MHGVLESDDRIFVYVYGCLQKIFLNFQNYEKTLIEAHTLFHETIKEMK